MKTMKTMKSQCFITALYLPNLYTNYPHFLKNEKLFKFVQK